MDNMRGLENLLIIPTIRLRFFLQGRAKIDHLKAPPSAEITDREIIDSARQYFIPRTEAPPASCCTK
jgi:hypothetical protein